MNEKSNIIKKMKQMPAGNKRFCKMAVEVLARMVVLGITFGRSPDCGWVEPPLRQYAGRYLQAGDSAAGQ